MDFNSQDSQEIMKNFKSIIGSRLEKLDNEKVLTASYMLIVSPLLTKKRKKPKKPPQIHPWKIID